MGLQHVFEVVVGEEIYGWATVHFLGEICGIYCVGQLFLELV